MEVGTADDRSVAGEGTGTLCVGARRRQRGTSAWQGAALTAELVHLDSGLAALQEHGVLAYGADDALALLVADGREELVQTM